MDNSSGRTLRTAVSDHGMIGLCFATIKVHKTPPVASPTWKQRTTMRSTMTTDRQSQSLCPREDSVFCAGPRQNVASCSALCCAFKHVRSGVFATHWKVEYQDARRTKPYVLLMDVDAIVRHCLMIPENDEGHGYHEAWEKERWAK
jgi:hypothetical protein